MANKVYEASTLQSAAEERALHYKSLKEQFERLKKEFSSIVGDSGFQGHGAEAIKGFYKAQMEVVDAWVQLIDMNTAFLKGIPGDAEDANLAGSTVVQVPFLKENVARSIRMSQDMVDEQQDALQRIFNDVGDLVSLNVFSKGPFEDLMHKAEKKRDETVEKVNELDQKLTQEYMMSQNQESLIYALFAQLMEATRQGENISPIHFNSEAYYAGEVHKAKSEVEQMTSEYLTFKEDQIQARIAAKEIEEMENRPWYEKTWDTVCTFTGEVTGYYDSKRAIEGVDPVTGRKLSDAERIAAGAMAAAGFIPVVGWAGRAVKGGSAIYKTARGVDAAADAMRVMKTPKGLTALQKTEYGIYGLVSANGFSEYFTGKDMFGNELTQEQRNQSMFNAFAILGVSGAGYAIDKMNVSKMIQNKFPYSTQYAKMKAAKAQEVFKAIGKNVGNVRVPVGFKVESMAAATGQTLKTITVDTKTAKELMQQASMAKGAGSKVIKGKYAAENLEDLRGYDSIIDEVLANYNISRNEFNALKLKDYSELLDEDVELLEAIRKSVSPITKDTLLQKTIPFKDIENYINGRYGTIGGYIAKAEDVHHIKSYKEFVESLRLDYIDGSGSRPFPEEGGSYGIIKFKTQFVHNVEIPFGEKFNGGHNKDGPPCTRNGFTGSRNGTVVPEYKFDNYYMPKHGAELFQVIDGKEILIGVYDGMKERFVPVN
ncbi:ribonuclease YeeF family protein [Fictibacillus aquaticus]|uniref:LXG domain-containing protein n=1 Tax=Fictibacillus aquaticus TaxID=2021314 RepID=A0A235F5W0_9BACL|nr:T7SS effector LXG polymorphic toxin [Fictibacillus aquaticus]OYD56564.1 hypothetical protein CGZ90_16255 [Fictibacillus aquaticus]